MATKKHNKLAFFARSIGPVFVQLFAARSLVVVPYALSVLQSIVLGVTLSSCQHLSFGLQAFSLLRAPRCDGTAPQYASFYDKLDFE